MLIKKKGKLAHKIRTRPDSVAERFGSTKNEGEVERKIRNILAFVERDDDEDYDPPKAMKNNNFASENDVASRRALRSRCNN